MTYEDAIQVIEDACFNCNHLALCDYCAKDTIKEALNKQIPKKVTYTKRTKCFNGHNIPLQCKNGRMPYCPFCGQRLDWSEE